MKIKILFGAIFSICIIMLVNTSSAVEYKTVTDYNTGILESKLEKIDIFIEKIRQTFEEIKINSITDTSSNDIREIYDQLSDLKILILGNPSLPNCILGILGLILSLLLSLIGTIIGIIFGPLIALFVRILTAPAVLLAKLIAFIINIFLP
jgi:hypothetical protein